MESLSVRRRRTKAITKAFIEIGFIIFLFYANLLMGEYTANSRHRTLIAALRDIFTLHTFSIALIAAVAGFVFFEQLRKRL